MFDVIVIGGSYAGIAATLQLARGRRKVLVVDAGQRRNRFASHSHGFLGQDGQPPEAIAAKGRAEVLAYPTVTWREGRVTRVRALEGGFAAAVGDSEERAKRLIFASGMVDVLPEIPGLAERWGKTAFHCPYCHGYELGLGELAVLMTNDMSSHQAVLATEWGKVTAVLGAGFEPNEEQRAELAKHAIALEPSPVVSFGGEAPKIDLRLRDGRTLAFDGLFLQPRVALRDDLASSLGCELDATPFGPFLKTDTMKETTVRGVFACGDVASPMPSLSFAVADGVRAGVAAHRSLVFTT